MNILFSIVLPIFSLIGLGFVCRKRGYFSASSIADFSRFVYYLAVPALLFLAMAQTSIASLGQLGFLWVYLGATVLAGVLVFSIARTWEASFEGRWLLGLGATFSNSVYLGIPLVQTGLGLEATQSVILIALATNIVFVAGSAIVLSSRTGAGGGSAIRETLTNPLLIAIALGLAFSASGFELPQGLKGALDLLAQAASPVALFALGLTLGGLSFASLALSRGPWLLVATKLVIHPALVALGCYGFGIQGLPMQVAVLVAALPAGALAHLLAERFGYQAGTVASAVLIGTLISIASLTGLLTVFAQL